MAEIGLRRPVGKDDGAALAEVEVVRRQAQPVGVAVLAHHLVGEGERLGVRAPDVGRAPRLAADLDPDRRRPEHRDRHGEGERHLDRLALFVVRVLLGTGRDRRDRDRPHPVRGEGMLGVEELAAPPPGALDRGAAPEPQRVRRDAHPVEVEILRLHQVRERHEVGGERRRRGHRQAVGGRADREVELERPPGDRDRGGEARLEVDALAHRVAPARARVRGHLDAGHLRAAHPLHCIGLDRRVPRERRRRRVHEAERAVAEREAVGGHARPVVVALPAPDRVREDQRRGARAARVAGPALGPAHLEADGGGAARDLDRVREGRAHLDGLARHVVGPVGGPRGDRHRRPRAVAVDAVRAVLARREIDEGAAPEGVDGGAGAEHERVVHEPDAVGVGVRLGHHVAEDEAIARRRVRRGASRLAAEVEREPRPRPARRPRHRLAEHDRDVQRLARGVDPVLARIGHHLGRHDHRAPDPVRTLRAEPRMAERHGRAPGVHDRGALEGEPVRRHAHPVAVGVGGPDLVGEDELGAARAPHVARAPRRAPHLDAERGRAAAHLDRGGQARVADEAKRHLDGLGRQVVDGVERRGDDRRRDDAHVLHPVPRKRLRRVRERHHAPEVVAKRRPGRERQPVLGDAHPVRVVVPGRHRVGEGERREPARPLVRGDAPLPAHVEHELGRGAGGEVHRGAVREPDHDGLADRVEPVRPRIGGRLDPRQRRRRSPHRRAVDPVPRKRPDPLVSEQRREAAVPRGDGGGAGREGVGGDRHPVVVEVVGPHGVGEAKRPVARHARIGGGAQLAPDAEREGRAAVRLVDLHVLAEARLRDDRLAVAVDVPRRGVRDHRHLGEERALGGEAKLDLIVHRPAAPRTGRRRKLTTPSLPVE